MVAKRQLDLEDAALFKLLIIVRFVQYIGRFPVQNPNEQAENEVAKDLKDLIDVIKSVERREEKQRILHLAVIAFLEAWIPGMKISPKKDNPTFNKKYLKKLATPTFIVVGTQQEIKSFLNEVLGLGWDDKYPKVKDMVSSWEAKKDYEQDDTVSGEQPEEKNILDPYCSTCTTSQQVDQKKSVYEGKSEYMAKISGEFRPIKFFLFFWNMLISFII